MKDAKGHGSDPRGAANKAGFAAGKAGKSGNPYAFGDPNRLEWEHGWTAGLQSLTAPAAHQSGVLKVGGASIERERDGTFSIYHAGNPYATTSGFKTSDEAARAVLRGR